MPDLLDSDRPPTDASLRRYLLSDVDPVAVSLVEKGANRQRIYMFKSGEVPTDDDRAVEVGTSRIIKSAPGEDWEAFYVVVAEPGAEEDPGLFTSDRQSVDVWASEDEIRKAAHRFMHNGALVNEMHKDFEAVGSVVENFVAPADFTVNGEIIRKGSWCVAIEPSDDGRERVNKGEFTGVSVQGLGLRTLSPLAKYDPAKTGMALPTLERVPGVQNWVDRVGGFPRGNWIYRAAKHLHYEKGMAIGHAIAVAVNAAKKLCSTGDLNYPGLQHANVAGQADACAGVAEWDAMKAKAGIAKAEGAEGPDDETEGSVCAVLLLIGIPQDQHSWLVPEHLVHPDDQEEEATLYHERHTMQLMKQAAEKDPIAAHQLSVLERLSKLLPGGDDDDCGCDDRVPIEKADLSTKGRKKSAKKGHALSDGSFPIENESDLRKAIKAVGRATSYSRAKAHVIKRAKALGLTSLLPAKWGVGEVAKQAGTVGSMSEGASTSTAADGGTDTGTDAERTIEERVESLEAGMEKVSKAVEPLAQLPGQIEELSKKLSDSDGDDEGDNKPSAEDLQKQLDDFTTTTAGELEKISKSVDKLATGDTAQPDDDPQERERIAKLDGDAKSNAELLA